MIFFVWFLAYFIGVSAMFRELAVSTELGNLEFWKEAGYGILGVSAVAAGVAIALARIILRLVMSQLHLGNDADERVTMVNTYLALRKGGHATEHHMQTVIERLFAPTADGIVRDDLGPVTPVETLRSFVSRER